MTIVTPHAVAALVVFRRLLRTRSPVSLAAPALLFIWLLAWLSLAPPPSAPFPPRLRR